MQPTNYETFVKQSRAAARDILRSHKVSNLLGYIRNINAKIKAEKSNHEEEKKNLERAQFNLRVAQEQQNPDLEQFQQSADNAEKVYAEQKQRFEKTMSELNDKIEEYQEKIENWNNGKSKVSYEEMVALATQLREKSVTSAFASGNYENVDTTDNDDNS